MSQFILDHNKGRRRSTSKTPTRETGVNVRVGVTGARKTGTPVNSGQKLQKSAPVSVHSSAEKPKPISGKPRLSLPASGSKNEDGGSGNRKHKLSYKEMIIQTIEQLQSEPSWKGYSCQVIKARMKDMFQVNTSQSIFNMYFGKAIKSAIEEGRVVRLTGQGLVGSFKLSSDYKSTKSVLALDIIPTSDQDPSTTPRPRARSKSIGPSDMNENISTPGTSRNFNAGGAAYDFHPHAQNHLVMGQQSSSSHTNGIAMDIQAIPIDSLQLPTVTPSSSILPFRIRSSIFDSTENYDEFETINLYSSSDDDTSNSIIEIQLEKFANQLQTGNFDSNMANPISFVSDGAKSADGAGTAGRPMPLMDTNGNVINGNSQFFWEEMGPDGQFRMVDLAGEINGMRISSLRGNPNENE